MKTSRKAQIFSQPLIFILAMVIGAMILFFGYRAIVGVNDTAGATLIKDWTKDLQQNVEESSYLDVGSVNTITVKLPGTIQYFCIKTGENPPYPSIFSKEDKAIIEANPDRNVLFLPADAYEISTLAKIPTLQGRDPLNCFHNGATLKLETVANGIVQAYPAE